MLNFSEYAVIAFLCSSVSVFGLWLSFANGLMPVKIFVSVFVATRLLGIFSKKFQSYRWFGIGLTVFSSVSEALLIKRTGLFWHFDSSIEGSQSFCFLVFCDSL